MLNDATGRKKKASLGLIFVTMPMMDVIGITLIDPIAPYLVQEYSNAAWMVTILTLLYAGGQFNLLLFRHPHGLESRDGNFEDLFIRFTCGQGL